MVGKWFRDECPIASGLHKTREWYEFSLQTPLRQTILSFTPRLHELRSVFSGRSGFPPVEFC